MKAAYCNFVSFSTISNHLRIYRPRSCLRDRVEFVGDQNLSFRHERDCQIGHLSIKFAFWTPNHGKFIAFFEEGDPSGYGIRCR